MSSPKQPHLNASYYGPSIPPPPKSYHRPKSGSSCNPCSCLCGCLLEQILKLLFSLLFTAALVLFLFWLAFRPKMVKFRVAGAALTQFNLTTTTVNATTLYYNLDLNLTVRNPNGHIGIYYDSVEARAFYGGQRFAVSKPPGFHQGEKNTTVLSVAMKGQNVVAVGQGKGKDDALSDYESEKGSGVYSITVKLYLRVRFKLRGIIKTPRFKPRIQCDLKVPLDSNSNGTAASKFETTKCGLHW